MGQKEIEIRLDTLEWGLFITDLESWDEIAEDQARFGDESEGVSRDERDVVATLQAQIRKQLGKEFVDRTTEAANVMHRVSTEEIHTEIIELTSRRPSKEQKRKLGRVPGNRGDTEPVVKARLTPEQWGILLTRFDVIDDMHSENIDATGPTTRDMAKLMLGVARRVRREVEGALGPALAADMREQAEGRQEVALDETTAVLGIRGNRDDKNRPAP